MTSLLETDVDVLNWGDITAALDARGYAVVPGFLSAALCGRLMADYGRHDIYRKTVLMERYRLGSGEYKYWDYPLPAVVQQLRETLYPRLVPIANQWMQALNIDRVFPDTLAQLQRQCAASGQHKPTSLILRYGAGGCIRTSMVRSISRCKLPVS